MDLLERRGAVFESLETRFPQAGRPPPHARRLFCFFRDDLETKAVAVGRGEKAAPGHGAILYITSEFFWCWTSPHPPRLATKEMLVTAAGPQIQGAMLFVSHDRRYLDLVRCQSCAEADAGGDSNQYGGGYTEYLVRTWGIGSGLRG